MNTTNSSLTIVVPCFNEQEHIAASIQDLLIAFATFKLPWEILVIDDFSSDRSEEILRTLSSKIPKLRVIRHATNMGLGAAYRTGVENASMSHVMLFPGDNEINAQSVREVSEFIGQADIIAPYAENPEIRRLSRRLISKTFTILINLICLHWLRYYNGPVIQAKSLLAKVNLKTNSFAYQAEIMVQLLKLGCTYKEVPFRLNYTSVRTRVFNRNNIVMIAKTLVTLGMIYWSPIPTRQTKSKEL